MTAVVPAPHLATPLIPVTATLRATFGTEDLPGLAPGLIVTDDYGWTPATTLVDGTHLPELLAAAARSWRGSPHACAALAFKAYSYWLALPAALGWAVARRVPLLDPADVLVRVAEEHGPPVMLGLRRSAVVAVLPGDPLSLTTRPDVRVVATEAELLGALRVTLLDAHLGPLAEALRAEVRIGGRTLLGSVAASIAHGLLQASDALPGSAVGAVDTLLDALGLRDLVEIVPGPDGEPTVQRRTCCLAFTLPQPTFCSGCCIRA